MSERLSLLQNQSHSLPSGPSPGRAGSPSTSQTAGNKDPAQALVPPLRPPPSSHPASRSAPPRRSTWIKNCVCPSPLHQSDHQEQNLGA